MTLARKQFASEAATLAQYAAINAALGLPRRDQHYGGGRHVDQDTPARLGWTLEGASVADGPGPTTFVVIAETVAAALDGVQPPGHVAISLSVRVAHSHEDERPGPYPQAASPAFVRRPAAAP